MFVSQMTMVVASGDCFTKARFRCCLLISLTPASHAICHCLHNESFIDGDEIVTAGSGMSSTSYDILLLYIMIAPRTAAVWPRACAQLGVCHTRDVAALGCVEETAIPRRRHVRRRCSATSRHARSAHTYARPTRRLVGSDVIPRRE